MTDTNYSGFVVKGVGKLPLQIPIELLMAQQSLGITAVMVWINMAMFVQQNQPVNIDLISEAMGVDSQEVNKGLAKLADKGWINDEGYEIKLCIPQAEQIPAISPVVGEYQLLNKEQRGFEWLVNFWSNKVESPTPEEMKKLLFWVEKKGVSHEVVAVAIEEMCAMVDNPNFGYLEGVLRNWVNEGVYDYRQLIDKPYLAKILHQSRPVSIHPEAERKWKELFPDEFDT